MGTIKRNAHLFTIVALFFALFALEVAAFSGTTAFVGLTPMGRPMRMAPAAQSISMFTSTKSKSAPKAPAKGKAAAKKAPAKKAPAKKAPAKKAVAPVMEGAKMFVWSKPRD